MIRTAIIGGTGVYDPKMLTEMKELSVDTPYGNVAVTCGKYEGQEVAFIARHGKGHSIPPHLINYRANIHALKQIGVENIIATTAVGSLNHSMAPGHFVLVDQFLDFTKSRCQTFFEGGEKGVVHVDVTEPYCSRLRSILAQSAKDLKVPYHQGGTYVCTEGPRFESPAEIKMYAKLGGDLVGMTNVPEVVLAREAEMCYATVSMVTNFAAGISSQALTHSEVVETMAQNSENFKKLIMTTLSHLTSEDCSCRKALQEYGGFHC